MPRKSTKKFKVIYSSLGRQKAYGVAHIGENSIEIDKNLYGKKHLEIAIHEMQHHVNPNMSEKDIIKWSIMICNTLWEMGYRAVDDSNHILLQDGTK